MWYDADCVLVNATTVRALFVLVCGSLLIAVVPHYCVRVTLRTQETSLKRMSDRLQLVEWDPVGPFQVRETRTFNEHIMLRFVTLPGHEPP